MPRKLVSFLKSPAGRRLLIWAAPIIISFITGLFSSSDKSKNSKKKRH